MPPQRKDLRALFAQSQRSSDWAPFFEVLAEKIRVAATGDELDALFRSRPCEDGVFDEGVYEGVVADALVDLASTTEDGALAALAVGWAAKASAFHPHALFLGDRAGSAKPRFLQAFSRHRAVIRKHLADPSAEKRAAFALALANCEPAQTKDADALGARLSSEPVAAVRATSWVACAALRRRAGGGAAAAAKKLRALALRDVAADDRLLALGAATFLALLPEPIDDTTLGILVGHLRVPSKLPSCWGWFWNKPKAWRSDAFVCWLATELRVTEPNVLKTALGKVEPQNAGQAKILARALERLGPVGATGATKEVRGRHPPLADLYLEVGLGSLGVQDAVRAAVAGLSAPALTKLIVRKSPDFDAADERLTHDAAKQRAFELLLALAAHLQRTGALDLEKTLDAAVKSSDNYRVPVLVCSWLANKPRTVAPKRAALIADALVFHSSREPLASLLKANVPLPLIEEALLESSAAEFYDLALTARVLLRLLHLVRQYPSAMADAEATLRRALPGARKMLASFDSDDARVAAVARKLIPKVLGN